MSTPIEIVSVNISEKKGTTKHPVEEAAVDGLGIVGDAHAGPWHRQISLLGRESVERFARETNRSIAPGAFAENITSHGVDLLEARLLDRFRFGGVELEVTQIGKACHGDGCAIFQEVGKCVMPKEGIFTRVLSGGTLRPGVMGEFIPKDLKIEIITLSDRASAGHYEDRSGPKVREILEDFFSDKFWRAKIENRILSDDANLLIETLEKSKKEAVDIIITTGATGLGPRDVAPETVEAFCDKLIPGIMEHIRVKFGAQNPKALLSRSVAGLAGNTLVYALPGSVRAVEEYLGEILLSLEHLLLMVHGIDAH